MVRQLRAVVILVVIVVNLLYAVPFPKMKEKDLEDPEWMNSDMELISELLGKVGIERSRAEVTDQVRSLAWDTRGVITTMRKPIQPVFRLTKTTQQWGLFASVTERPDRLFIEVDRGDEEWERIYQHLDPEMDWRQGLFRFRRVRGIWDSVSGKQPKGTYIRLSKWVARQIMLEDPTVERVRFGLERIFLTPPFEQPDNRVKRRGEQIHTREGLFESDDVDLELEEPSDADDDEEDDDDEEEDDDGEDEE